MSTLLDFIFDNLTIDSLNRSEVQQHLSYLEEIGSQLPANFDRVKFQRIKVLMDNRLVELDK